MKHGRGDVPDRRWKEDLDAEIAFHIEMREAQNLARGMDEASARREALERFGDIQRVRDACRTEDDRATWRARLFGGLGADLRQGIRQLRRSPVYALIAVLTLAFGIGTNVLQYGFMAPYFLRPLPFENAERLLHLYQVGADGGYPRERFSMPQYRDLLERSRSFRDIAAYDYRAVNLTGPEGPERLTVGRLTPNAFDVLGVRPLHGRTFADEDAVAGGANVIVLGWGVWQRRYAGDPGVIGRTVAIDGMPHTVIGVMPREFNFPFGGVKSWVPLDARADGVAREVRPHLLFGVLADGWTRERAEAELDAIHATLAAEYPDAEGESAGIALVDMREALNFGWYILRPISLALGAAVALLLLIACANIAGLGLARAEMRRHEIAVRGALGASSFRVIRQVIVEMLVLATLGGILGLVLARGGLRALNAVMPEDLFRIGEFGVDTGALVFVTAVVAIAAIAAGIAPALLAARSDAGSVLREDQRTAGSVRAGVLRRVLVVSQVAVGVVLVVCAGLTARSLQSARDVQLGFEPDNVLAVELTLPEASYPDAADVRDLYRRYLAALRELPVVRSAGTQTAIPLNHENPSVEVGIEGVAIGEDERPRAWFFRISPGYLEAIGTRLLEGRAFTELDGPDGERVALVNRTFAERLLDGDAIGRVIVPGQGTAYRVVGVIDDVLHTDIGAPAGPQLYVPASQAAPRRQFVVIRTAGEPEAAVPAVRSALASLDADLPATFLPLADVVDVAVMPWSMMAASAVVFGVFALLLGAIGLYGVIAFSVERRRRELGVRLALGADRRALLRLVVSEGLRLAAMGIAIGLVGAFGAGRLLASLLFGVRPEDPVTLAGATVVLLAVAVVATLVPARRALRADPLEALRSS